MNNNEELFKVYSQKMCENGVFIPPQAYKRSHITTAHSIDDLKATVNAARIALHECRLQMKENAVVSVRHRN